MTRAKIYLGVFQETKVTSGVYMRGSDGYNVIADDATIRHQGGISVFYNDPPILKVEEHQNFGPNFSRFQLTLDRRWWYIMDCYLDLENTSTIGIFIAAIGHHSSSTQLLVAGDLNLYEPNKDEETVTAMVVEGLKDMSTQLLTLHTKTCDRDGRAWITTCLVQEVRYRMYYLLGKERHLFWNVSIQ